MMNAESTEPTEDVETAANMEAPTQTPLQTTAEESGTSSVTSSINDLTTLQIIKRPLTADCVTTAILDTSRTVRGSKERPAEQSLAAINYYFDFKEWHDIMQPLKDNLVCKLMRRIAYNVQPNVEISIGGFIFYCQLPVLKCYSGYFSDNDKKSYIELPEDEISVWAFAEIYKWMIIDKPQLKRNGIVELFKAATFLRIKYLINQCWSCFQNHDIFNEENAVVLYFEAKDYGIESLQRYLTRRIHKFFLILVASKDFLEMSAKEITALLSSNGIGVNSEIETLMSAIRWLSHDWNNREKHVLDIIKCIRFDLVPTHFLAYMQVNYANADIQRIMKVPEIRQLVNQGLCAATTRQYFGETSERFKQYLQENTLAPAKQRRWIFDKRCPYHKRHIECPNNECFNYKSFLQYLERLQNVGVAYWHSLEFDETSEVLIGANFNEPDEEILLDV